MSTFDQRGQKVNYQYNIAGNLNFGGATTSADVALELKKLLQEVTKATLAGVIDAENGVEVESNIKKAVIQAEKPQPNKQIILDYINGAKAIIESLTSAAGLVGGFMQAIEMIRRVF
ncbi:MAG: hypothetical protein IH589_04250 [Anaerolineales bacterium]|nr:hypothetical protein [Anaerolineales bacterium]